MIVGTEQKVSNLMFLLAANCFDCSDIVMSHSNEKGFFQIRTDGTDGQKTMAILCPKGYWFREEMEKFDFLCFGVVFHIVQPPCFLLEREMLMNFE